jgi:serine/threonine-protein kinase
MDSRPVAGRYQVLRPHAKGGLGEVFVALDTELNREVALKEIQPQRAQDRASRSRFLLEAEVTGALEHPGIVPVYGLGAYPDERPFYAMRFIQGESLKEALARFHQAPNFQGTAFRQLLRRFVDVCNAVAYAHSRGVLHRDLKPANVMLGPFGETLVVDWGLAKVIGRDPTGGAGAATLDEPTLQPASASDHAATLVGTVLGTPAYMSPEQMGGRVEELGPASDVYSLGATLYAVLTGRAPFDGSDRGAVLRQVQRGDFPPPRQVLATVPRALDAVCRKAMALKAAERYATPLALAADVERWLADEPVAGYREPWPSRLGRWARKHRALVASAVVLLTTAVVALAAGLLAVNAERRRTLAEQERTQQALQAEARRRQQTRQALDALTGQVVEEWLARQKQMLPEHTEFLKRALQSYEEFARDTAEDEASRAGVAAAYRRVGRLQRLRGQTQEAAEAFGRSRDCYAQLAADFPANPDYQHELAQSHTQLGVLFETTGRPQEAEAEHRQALALYASMAPDHARLPEIRQGWALSHNSLAVLCKVNGRLQEAEAEYREALAVQRQLVAECPERPEFRWDLAQTHHNLSILLSDRARWQEAEASRREALALQQRLVADFPTQPDYAHELAESYNGLGNLLKRVRQTQQADAAFRTALGLHRRLAADFPARPDYRQELATALNNLGVLLYSAGRLQEAESAYREDLAISQRLAADFPQVPNFQNDVAAVLVNLALVVRDRGQLAQARQLLQQAVLYHQAALRASPRHPTYQLFYRNNRLALAETLLRLGEAQEAAATADELVQAAVRPEEDLYQAARYLARCVVLTEKESQLSPSRRRELADGYAARAVALLRQVVQKGYQDVGHLKKDSDLEGLRDRGEFKQLLSQSEQKGAGPGK